MNRSMHFRKHVLLNISTGTYSTCFASESNGKDDPFSSFIVFSASFVSSVFAVVELCSLGGFLT